MIDYVVRGYPSHGHDDVKEVSSLSIRNISALYPPFKDVCSSDPSSFNPAKHSRVHLDHNAAVAITRKDRTADRDEERHTPLITLQQVFRLLPHTLYATLPQTLLETSRARSTYNNPISIHPNPLVAIFARLCSNPAPSSHLHLAIGSSSDERHLQNPTQ
jgi:hypothetical protein